MTGRPAFVDFHFDVMCPYAYQTSRWIREVRRLTGLTVNWRFFSLEEINRQEGKKHPWEREWSYGWSMMRIGALLRRRSMADLDAWYERAGRALHVEGHKPHEKAVARQLLEELGFDPALVDQVIADVAFSPDGRQLATGEVVSGHDNPAREVIVIRDGRTGSAERQSKAIRAGRLAGFARGGSRLLVTREHLVLFFDTGTHLHAALV